MQTSGTVKIQTACSIICGDLDHCVSTAASVPLQTQQPGKVPGLPVLPCTPDVPTSTRLRQSIQDRLKQTVSPLLPAGTFSITDVAKLQGVPTSTDDSTDAPPSADPSNPLGPDMALVCREGGKALMMLLLHVAHAEKSSKPVHEWTYHDVVKLPEAEHAKWLGKDGAYAKELEALKERDVFGPLIDLPPGRKAIDNRWVHDIKRDGRLKARLVVKGFSQVKGMDYNQVFLLVVRFETVRVMLALCALENWHIEGLDVCNAYLYGKLEEEIYMQQPEGFKVKGKEHMVIRLNHALYGLKQAGLVWYWTLAKSLKEIGLTPINPNAGINIYWRGDNFVIAIVYVDDALFVGPNPALTRSVKDMVMKKWDCRNLGESGEFIGITFTRHDGKIYLDQRDYLKKVIKHCGMQNAKLAPMPLPAGYVPVPNNGPVNPELQAKYQMVIGSLMFLMLGTRPNITFAVTKLAQYATNPSKDHYNKALYVVRYLTGTRKYSLAYDGNTQYGLLAYTDLDWASDQTTCRSQTGFFLKLGNGIVTWTSRAQHTVALSSTEAEYMAISDCTCQCVWIKTLLEEIGYTPDLVPICGDNQGSIFIASNAVTDTCSKHINIRYHYIRGVVADSNVKLYFIEGAENPVDMFTKNLARPKFKKFRAMLGLEFYAT
jgi:hypothetical protein